MTEINRTGGIVAESAILAAVLLPDHASHGDPLAELKGLAESAGAMVADSFTQRRAVPDRATYLGKGKVEELIQPAQEKADEDSQNHHNGGKTRRFLFAGPNRLS